MHLDVELDHRPAQRHEVVVLRVVELRVWNLDEPLVSERAMKGFRVGRQDIDVSESPAFRRVEARELRPLEQHERAVGGIPDAAEKRWRAHHGERGGPLLVGELLRQRTPDDAPANRGERPELVREDAVETCAVDQPVNRAPELASRG